MASKKANDARIQAIHQTLAITAQHEAQWHHYYAARRMAQAATQEELLIVAFHQRQAAERAAVARQHVAMFLGVWRKGL